ncbi:UpxY family transcription antiterminator [Desertivirga arenae]|uniref:UpxY family transcription antiterminator n=1 Tax=Desertivirga arenae TaxID=2810309 RepID=UPI001A95C2D9|nr:UpxY family transcription antiterminator [Pedobacter sp. SYSU D00823]
METRTFKKPEKKWLAVYTRPRWEKKIDHLLKEQGVESFCPVRRVESQWADRKKVVELPLFNSYVFVKVDPKEELTVRQTIGVLNFIYYMGKPAVLRESEMENIKHLVDTQNDIEVISLSNLSVGDRVMIKSGIMSKQEGAVLKINGKNVLMVFDKLDFAVVTRVDLANLTPVTY